MAAQIMAHNSTAANVILKLTLSVPAVTNDQCVNAPAFLTTVRLPNEDTVFGVFWSNTAVLWDVLTCSNMLIYRRRWKR